MSITIVPNCKKIPSEEFSFGGDFSCIMIFFGRYVKIYVVQISRHAVRCVSHNAFGIFPGKNTQYGLVNLLFGDDLFIHSLFDGKTS